MYQKTEKHEFAFYWPALSKNNYSSDTTISITDEDLYHRITRVLRLKKDDQLILFDRIHNLSGIVLDNTQKNKIIIKVIFFTKNNILKPTITFLLPLLKRDAFENTLYSLTELGVNEIQLITTKKTQRRGGGQKEKERLEKIVIAAAEQSKNFVFPIVHEPLGIEQIIKNSKPSFFNIFFDPKGCQIFDLIKKIRKETPEQITLLIGPEGDLTQEEKKILENANFTFCQLTPTILRAQQAAVVSLGLIRSLIM